MLKRLLSIGQITHVGASLEGVRGSKESMWQLYTSTEVVKAKEREYLMISKFTEIILQKTNVQNQWITQLVFFHKEMQCFTSL